jgi:hypothetical protein
VARGLALVAAPLVFGLTGRRAQAAGPIYVWLIMRAHRQPSWVETQDALIAEISDCRASEKARPCGSRT